ncbi:MAG TPA: hypothetical protein VF656_06480 [Pyrinomonadaceae bacterium]|jgi:hypothetical protein
MRARPQATARALENAAELVKDEDNSRFFQLLETSTKIADKSKHTFIIGDLQQGGLDLRK